MAAKPEISERHISMIQTIYVPVSHYVAPDVRKFDPERAATLDEQAIERRLEAEKKLDAAFAMGYVMLHSTAIDDQRGVIICYQLYKPETRIAPRRPSRSRFVKESLK
jgi:hypothetical protein